MRLLLTFLLGVLLAVPALAQGDGRIFPYPYQTRDLPNGLRVVVIPTGLPDVVSLQIAVGTGSRNEVEPGKSGFAHFFEHMMFRGTENITNEEYTSIVKRMGASQNAYTSSDRTVYHMTLLAEDLPEAMRLEADRFQHLAYSEADFRTEALAVLGEYNKNFANPLQQLFEAQAETAFTVHPYGHTTMGYLADVEDMPNEYDYSQTFFRRYYRPENATLLVAGDVDPEAVFRLAEQYWGSWEAGFDPAPIPDEPAPDGARYRHVTVEAATPPWVTVAFRGPAAYPTPDNPASGDMQALDVLSQMAFSPSSDLYRRLVVEEQKVDQLFAGFGDSVDPELLTIGARLKDPADAAYVRDAIQQELARLRVTLPDAGRLAELKSRLRYGFVAGLTTTEAIAGAVVPVLAATRDVNTLEAIYRNYAAVTPEDVRRVANTYFVDRGMVVVTLAQGDLPADAMQAGSVDARMDGAAAAPEAAAPAPVDVPRREGAGGSIVPTFRERVMANASPLVNFRFLFATGAADDPEGKEGLAQLTASMVADAGSRLVTYADAQRAFFPMAAGLGAQVDKEMTVFGGSVHVDNLDRYYDLVGGMLLDPGFRDEDFQRVRQDLVNDIRVGLRANNDEELGKEVLYEM
ncbi:MAG TPA: insulinase family protein, partial [Rhodothermales bacterium]|nr:insulinase family protein [Rhodothermales bacterium]